MTNIIKRIPIKYIKWYFTVAMLYGTGFAIWGIITNRPDYLMGVFGNIVLMTLYDHLDEKPVKFSELDKMILITFGLTTVLIPFIT